jgi:hypothetical protein
MKNRIGQLPSVVLVVLLCSALVASAEPIPQIGQSSGEVTSKQVTANDASESQSPATATQQNPAPVPMDNELPDAPSSAEPVQQSQSSSSIQSQEPSSVPSGAAGAKAPTVRGAPASRTVGAAIAPAKQKQRRSFLIKAGLIAGACVAVGSAFALSKGSPSKPPGAP